MKGDFAMYENENKNMNGLGNETVEHRDIPETTVNWTTPGDGRNQQGQGNQSARFQHIPIRAVRAAAINVRTVQTRDASPNGWPESRQQQSSLEPCQAE